MRKANLNFMSALSSEQLSLITARKYSGRSKIIKLLLEGGIDRKAPRVPNSVKSGRYGYLSVNANKRLGKGRFITYLCRCQCGKESYLNRKNIQVRMDLGAGCLGPSCKLGKLSTLVWTNVEVGLWLQLSEMLYNKPEEVLARWGGSLDSESKVEIEQGFDNFKQDVMPMVDVKLGKWWLVLSNPDSLFIPENISRTSTDPDLSVFPNKNLAVGLYGISSSLPDLSKALKFNLSQAYELRKEIVSVDQYIEKLID